LRFRKQQPDAFFDEAFIDADGTVARSDWHVVSPDFRCRQPPSKEWPGRPGGASRSSGLP
jgi:hypothetical protein